MPFITTSVGGDGSGAVLPQDLGTTDTPTFSTVTLTSNGGTNNITIGDDVILGDGNVANHVVIIGQQDDTAGGIVLGTNETEFISTNGTDLSITADNDIVLYPGSNYAYLNAIDEDHRLATMADILSGGVADGESTIYLVRNNTASTILKGTLVSAVGAEPSGRIDVAPHETTGLQNSELRVMGMATTNITNGVNGTVMSFGTLTGLDTRGNTASAIAVGDETWAAGDILYAHPTADGKLTNVKPQHDLAVAFITVRHASSGQIAIRIVPGNNHLEWMHDVEIIDPVDTEVLAYDSASGLWKNQAAPSGSSDIADFVFTDNYNETGNSGISLPGDKGMTIAAGEDSDLYLTAGDDLYLQTLNDDIHLESNDDIRFVTNVGNGGTEPAWRLDTDGYLYGPGSNNELKVIGIMGEASVPLFITTGDSVVLNGTNGEFLNSSTNADNQIATVGDLNNAVSSLSDTGWINITSLSNSFVSGGTTPAYRKLNGVVYMRGNMNQGTGEATAFTLPEGFRPGVETVIITQKFGTATGTYVTILADGSVKPHDDATWLSGISFIAE